MDVCIRPSQIGRLGKTAYLSCMAAILCVGLLEPSFAARQAQEDSPPALADPFPSTDQLVSIVRAPAGTESVTLTARLSQSSTRPVDGMIWQITSVAGETLIAARTGELNAQLPPGEYKVIASIGHKKIEEPLTLPQGSKLNISYVLNAGALRVLPRLAMPTAGNLDSNSRIYALSGALKGQLLANTRVPGEILVLAAGDYRIESSLAHGNVSAVADVHVKSGIMSAVEIDHVAGLVNFVFDNGREWNISTADGQSVTTLNVGGDAIALQPGNYVAASNGALRNEAIAFEIIAGQQIEINLPN
jgi:hypothetical protein